METNFGNISLNNLILNLTQNCLEQKLPIPLLDKEQYEAQYKVALNYEQNSQKLIEYVFCKNRLYELSNEHLVYYILGFILENNTQEFQKNLNTCLEIHESAPFTIRTMRGLTRCQNDDTTINYFKDKVKKFNNNYQKNAVKTSQQQNVKRFEKNEIIQKIQEILCKKGYQTLIDGILSDKLEKQIIKYQKENGFYPDGQVTSALTDHLEGKNQQQQQKEEKEEEQVEEQKEIQKVKKEEKEDVQQQQQQQQPQKTSFLSSFLSKQIQKPQEQIEQQKEKQLSLQKQSQQQQQAQNQKKPASQIPLNLLNAKNIIGVSFTEDKKNIKLLMGPSNQKNIDFQHLILCLLVYSDPSIQSKNICFSLDPWDENNPEGPYQRKVVYPDFIEGKKVVEGTKFSEIMFECDYILKQMSLGLQPDCKSPFEYPERLRNLNFKNIPQLLKEESDKKKGDIQHSWSRLWLICKEIFIEENNQSFYCHKNAKIGVEARQMMKDEQGKLIDRLNQDPNDVCYIFAEQLSGVFKLVEEDYPEFEDLKCLFRANALAKFIYQKFGKNFNISKLEEVVLKEQKVNNYCNKINAIIQKEEIMQEKQEKIPVNSRTVALRFLQKNKQETTENNLMKVIEHIIKQNGGSEEFFDIQSTKTLQKKHILGGVDMDVNIQLIQKYQDFPTEASFEQSDFSYFLESKTCLKCKNEITSEEAKYSINNGKEYYCSLHHPYSCFYCHQIIAENGVQVTGNAQLFDSDLFVGQSVYMHSGCNFIFQNKCIDEKTIEMQDKQIQDVNKGIAQQINSQLKRDQDLQDMKLSKKSGFVCQLCKKINNTEYLTCMMCDLVNSAQANLYLQQEFKK